MPYLMSQIRKGFNARSTIKTKLKQSLTSDHKSAKFLKQCFSSAQKLQFFKAKPYFSDHELGNFSDIFLKWSKSLN